MIMAPMHSLDGPRLKIGRAVSHIDRLASFEESLWGRYEYKVVKAEFNRKAGKDVYRVSTNAPPDFPFMGIRVGEIAHNLRSALDGLVYQLALLGPGTPAPNTEFPIFLVGRTKRKRPSGGLISHFNRDGRSEIRSLRSEHQTPIEPLQPYKGGRGGKLIPFGDFTRLTTLTSIGSFKSSWGDGRLALCSDFGETTLLPCQSPVTG